MHNTDLGFFIFSFCYIAILEECTRNAKDEFRTAVEIC